MDNIDEFLADMRDVRPDVLDYADALVFAMLSVQRVDDGGEAFYFGKINHGTFFSCEDFAKCRWFPDTKRVEVLGIIGIEFGEEIADILS